VRIERVVHHPISPAETYAMSITPAYQERKCADAGALQWEVDVRTKDDDTAVVRARRKLPTTGFPALVRKVVPGGVTSTETIAWGPPTADGSRVGKLSVDFHGAPVRMNGELRLVPEDGGCRIDVTADFSVLVPVVGRKIEQMAGGIVVDVIESEERTAQQWISGSR
jgi:hypothetical protein